MSNTYETYVSTERRRNQYLLAPGGIRAWINYHATGGASVFIAEDEEQPQAPAAEPAKEEADEDIPLNFELTEACFRGLPPGVDAGEEQAKKRVRTWEDVAFSSIADAGRGRVVNAIEQKLALLLEDALVDGRLDPDGFVTENRKRLRKIVLEALGEAEPAAPTAESAGAQDAIVAALQAMGPGEWQVVPDGPVESWAAEAEAKRWRGDIDHVLRSCNICGCRTPFGAPTCRDCEPLFMALWVRVGASWPVERRELILPDWDAAVREHPGYVPAAACIWTEDPFRHPAPSTQTRSA